MGMLDAIQSEDRIQVKFSDFYSIVKRAAKAEILENAVNADVPNMYVRGMITGKCDLLEEYKKAGVLPEDIKEMEKALRDYQDSGLTPDDLKFIDNLYQNSCSDNAKLKQEIEDLKKCNADLRKQLDDVKDDSGTATQAETTADLAEQIVESLGEEKTLQQLSGVCVPASTPEDQGGDNHKDGGKRKQIDIGKIMALKNAGWKVKDIADEMHMEPSAISNAIWRHNKSLEGKDNESES